MINADVPGYDGRYTVDPYGTVISYRWGKPKVHKWKIGTDGYPRVSMDGRWELVHLVILKTFVGSCPNGLEARHLNNDPMKPMLSQLTWDTHSNNVLDKRTFGTDHNAIKTECVNGHPFDEENTYVRTDRGWIGRECKTCNREAAARYRDRKRVAP